MLPIQLSGHGVEITTTLNDFIHKKFERVRKHSDHITSIHVFLNVSKHTHKAETTIHIPGREFYASAEAEDMYKAIDLLIDKIVRQMDKHKEKTH